MIAVTGATGQLGQHVIESLLAKTAAKNIIALVRNIEKAQPLKQLGIEVREADYSQPETLTSALVGVDKLLLISGSEVGQRVAQHQAVIDAAKIANVKMFVYTSLLKADTSPMILAQEHKITEAAIKASGLPAVIIRNGWYSENYVASIGGTLQAGVVAGSAGEGLMHTATRQDYAEAAAIVLTNVEDHVGKVYELAGDEGFTLAQYAQLISQISGKDIDYQAMSEADFTAMLVSVGLPEGLSTILADAEVQAEQGWLADDSKY